MPHTSIRDQLAKLARSKRTRLVGHWRNQEPSKWFPHDVADPSTGQAFTEPGAWEYIADLIEAGHPFEEVSMEKPPDTIGYVLKVACPPDVIYIKLRLKPGYVIGRSFHYSDY